MQRAPQQLFFYYNKLQVNNLTTNRAVGSSNLSGRAKNKRPLYGAFSLTKLLRELCVNANPTNFTQHGLDRNCLVENGPVTSQVS